ncbi:MAG TPA: DNA-binding protein [Microvirga sp.]|nr:DNA-binding protein [Microvirga sp.]
MRPLSVLVLLALAAGTLPAPRAAARPVCPPAMSPDRIEAVTEDGELVLRTAGLARLAGVRLPLHAPARAAALAWLSARRGHAALVQAGPARDRWDRLPVRIVLTEGGTRLDVAHGLLESGLALVDPATGDGGCLAEILAIEATARERALGLWAQDRYKPVAVADTARVRERIGEFTLVEGRIRSVGERRQQTYLNFGTDWASDFTIILPKRVWSLLQQRGLGAASLRGRRIRARGVVDEWRGPALTVTAAEAIEVLDGARPRE